MEKLVKRLQKDYPSLKLIKGSVFCWSPQTNEIVYSAKTTQIEQAKYTLFHELAHALLGHTEYKTDFELLQLEIAAWEHAKSIANKYSLAIGNDYIQNCLDSYRDWLYKRSICPRCGSKSMQADDPTHYRCFNCHNRWFVANSKFCRTYRQHRSNKKSPTPTKVQTIF